jgi:hypothetical protein
MESNTFKSKSKGEYKNKKYFIVLQQLYPKIPNERYYNGKKIVMPIDIINDSYTVFKDSFFRRPGKNGGSRPLVHMQLNELLKKTLKHNNIDSKNIPRVNSFSLQLLKLFFDKLEEILINENVIFSTNRRTMNICVGKKNDNTIFKCPEENENKYNFMYFHVIQKRFITPNGIYNFKKNPIINEKIKQAEKEGRKFKYKNEIKLFLSSKIQGQRYIMYDMDKKRKRTLKEYIKLKIQEYINEKNINAKYSKIIKND